MAPQRQEEGYGCVSRSPPPSLPSSSLGCQNLHLPQKQTISSGSEICCLPSPVVSTWAVTMFKAWASLQSRLFTELLSSQSCWYMDILNLFALMHTFVSKSHRVLLFAASSWLCWILSLAGTVLSIPRRHSPPPTHLGESKISAQNLQPFSEMVSYWDRKINVLLM